MCKSKANALLTASWVRLRANLWLCNSRPHQSKLLQMQNNEVQICWCKILQKQKQMRMQTEWGGVVSLTQGMRCSLTGVALELQWHCQLCSSLGIQLYVKKLHQWGLLSFVFYLSFPFLISCMYAQHILLVPKLFLGNRKIAFASGVIYLKSGFTDFSLFTFCAFWDPEKGLLSLFCLSAFSSHISYVQRIVQRAETVRSAGFCLLCA